MKIAVTGSNGFVGKTLVKFLEENGNEVISIDKIGGLDITNWVKFQKTPLFNALVHLAANSFIPDSFIKPREFFSLNFTGTLHALELCRKYNARMIYISSYVYGEPKYLPVDEKHPINPTNPYAQSKIMGEELCGCYNRDFNIPVTIIRPFNLYGPGQNENFLIPTIINMLKSGEVVLKDSRPKRDLLHVNDFTKSLVKVINSDLIGFNVINIGSGYSLSVKEIVEIIVKLSGKKIEIQYLNENRPGEIMNTVADITRARKLLNWKPEIDLAEGLQMLIQELDL